MSVHFGEEFPKLFFYSPTASRANHSSLKWMGWLQRLEISSCKSASLNNKLLDPQINLLILGRPGCSSARDSAMACNFWCETHRHRHKFWDGIERNYIYKSAWWFRSNYFTECFTKNTFAGPPSNMQHPIPFYLQEKSWKLYETVWFAIVTSSNPSQNDFTSHKIHTYIYIYTYINSNQKRPRMMQSIENYQCSGYLFSLSDLWCPDSFQIEFLHNSHQFRNNRCTKRQGGARRDPQNIQKAILKKRKQSFQNPMETCDACAYKRHRKKYCLHLKKSRLRI